MSGPRYRVEPAACRLIVEMDGMTLIYHRSSGATHVLAGPAPELIAALEAGPAGAAELAGRLAKEQGIEAEGDIVAVIGARLEELAAAGLIAAA